MKNLFLIDSEELLDELIDIIKYNIDIIDDDEVHFNYEKDQDYHEIRHEILERMKKDEY
jgi:hypothetical protein